ncbi:MAG: restriction endonuclease subunit S, partial [Lachnospiraceae bacterium]|nr:restriction endonuclease subunit S [Lachnospiraceae bacterium]
LNIRDLEDGRISFPEHSRLRAKASDWEEKFGIQEGDIIMTSKGSVLKICMVEPGMPKAFLSENLTRIRVDPEKYSSCVLYEFLTSQEGREALDSIQSGTTIKIYNKTNLSRLQIPYYENARELQAQFRQVYEEYRTSMREIRQKFTSDRERLLKKLQ